MPAARKPATLVVATAAILAAFTLAGSAGGVQLPGKRDREAPTAPTNVHVTSATPTSVSLAWDASTDNVGVAFYYVYVDAVRARVSGTTYTAVNLECGQSIGVWIVAYDGALNRSPSAAATVSTAPCPDTEAPTPPTGFEQAATTGDAVVLEWQGSSDNVGVVGYGVYRNELPLQSTSQPTVTLTGLFCGQTLEYEVDAYDAAGNRSERSTAWVQTEECVGPPADKTAPTGPEDLRVVGVTRTSVSLRWSASSDNVGVTGYDVYKNGTRMASVAGTSFDQTGLTCGSSNWFGVEALDAAGNRSSRTRVNTVTSPCDAPTTGWSFCAGEGQQCTFAGTKEVRYGANGVFTAPRVFSNTVSCTNAVFGDPLFGVVKHCEYRDLGGTPPPPSDGPPAGDTAPPSQPTNLAVPSVSKTSVSLAWSASTDNVGVTGYSAYVNGTKVLTTSQPGATVPGLACGTAFTFAVDAFDAAGNRSAKAQLTASTAACADAQAPTTPTNVAAPSRTATSIALTWSASTDNVGVTGYGLYRGGTLVGSAPTTTYIFAGLTCNTNYTLAVDAFDAGGNRSGKATVLVSTSACADTTAPTAPTAFAASGVTQTGLSLSWNASSDNVAVVAYDVYRNGTKAATVTSKSWSDGGLACGTLYWFGVEALDAAGNRSARAHTNATTTSCAPPPPPPAPSGGTVIDGFGDTSTPWGKNLINRWQPVNGDHWSAPGDSGSAYSSGGGMWEVSTPHGPGFKMVATTEMTVPSGGKMSLIADIGNLVQGVGHTEDWSGMVMLPASGNPNGFPRNYPDWTLLWEFHSQGGVPAQMGIDTTESPYRNHLYFRSMGRKVLAPAEIEYDRWYSWRCVITWSYGSDGLFECWLDGQKLVSWTGPTLAAGEIPYLQFGFYSANSLRNEAWHARFRKA